ncbi:MAG: PepSY domain-containing protein, partial [Lachnospiraceae bacterium]|nr:PepSY domain-containing protein [Lachnospiraceae bacterium]
TMQGQDGQTVQGQTMQGQQGQPAQDSLPDTPQDSQGGAQSDIGIEQAKEAALVHAGLEAASVTFTKEKLDHDDGIARYEIEFVTDTTKYEYEINASDAAVMEASLEPIEQISATAEQQDIITLEEAKAAALDYAGMSAEQVRFTKIEQDYDDGMTEYEIEFYTNGKEYSFAIDAVTGSVLEMEIEMD